MPILSTFVATLGPIAGCTGYCWAVLFGKWWNLGFGVVCGGGGGGYSFNGAGFGYCTGFLVGCLIKRVAN